MTIKWLFTNICTHFPGEYTHKFTKSTQNFKKIICLEQFIEI